MKKKSLFLFFLSIFLISNSQEKVDTTYLKKVDLISNQIGSTYPTTKQNVNLEKLNTENLGQDFVQ